MAKVLISALGSNSKRGYRKANYLIDNKTYEEPFIGIALTKHFNIDKNIIIGTSKSLWEEYYKVYAEYLFNEYNEELYFHLAENIEEDTLSEKDLTILNKSLNKTHYGLLIEDGMNNDELMKNFEVFMRVTERLDDGDELYIDITHSFRSISLYMFIIMNYLQNVTDKNIKIKGITYGMLGAEVDGKTPVVNLNILYEAIEWIKAASDFKKFGNSHLLTDLIDDQKTKTKLQNFTEALNLSYVVELKNQIKQLEQIKDQESSLSGFAKFIIPPTIDDFLDRFKGYVQQEKEYLFQFEIAKYFYEKEMYSNAYLILHESIITYIIEGQEELKVYYNDKDVRHKVKGVIYHYQNNKNNKWNKKYKDLIEDNDFRELIEVYDNITDIRNSIAHAAEKNRTFRSDIISFEKRKDKLSRIYQKNRSFYISDYFEN
jgi:CRISPR-associated Csx2 family protein